MSDFDKIINNAGISYEYFLDRLLEIYNDCNHENYLAEVFIPFFRMCCIDDVKVVPVFDDRKTGRKTENDTDAKKRMQIISAKKYGCENQYVVPDYIYVPREYSFYNPKKPIIMVETKNPCIISKNNKSKGTGYFYRSISDSIEDNENELLSEIQECGLVIYTDGLTWMFLEEKDGKIIESEKYETLSLVNLGDKYYKTNKVEKKNIEKEIDLTVIGIGKVSVKDVPDEWEKIIDTIKEILNDLHA